jgi:hypothetical protein
MIVNSFAGGFFCAKEGSRREEKNMEESIRFTFNILRVRLHVSLCLSGVFAEDTLINLTAPMLENCLTN